MVGVKKNFHRIISLANRLWWCSPRQYVGSHLDTEAVRPFGKIHVRGQQNCVVGKLHTQHLWTTAHPPRHEQHKKINPKLGNPHTGLPGPGKPSSSSTAAARHSSAEAEDCGDGCQNVDQSILHTCAKSSLNPNSSHTSSQMGHNRSLP